MSNQVERFKKMVEDSQDWFWEFDENANFTYVSPSIRDLLGYEPEELIGLNAFDLMSSDEAERVRKHFDPIAKKYLPFKNLENVNLHKDGRPVVIESSGTPIFNEEGQFCGYRGIDRDITARKMLKKNYQRLAKLTSDYVHRCIRTGKSEFQVQWVDGAIKAISGYRLDDILSLGCFLPMVHPDDRQTVSDYLLGLKPGDVKAIEFRIVTQQQEIRWVHEQSRCERGRLEGELVLLGAVTDITERKNAEIRLRESNKELDAFVNTVAHDLRTPVTPIIGYAEILRENYKELLDKQGLFYLAEIEKAGGEMLVLMENLLSLAKSGNIKRPAKHISTDEVVAGVIKSLETDSSSVGVTLQATSLPPVHLPKTFLIQIFDNLIGNAIRYAGKSSDLIEVGGERIGRKVRFFVRDHGPGIPQEEREHIFEIFYRGTNTGEVNGSGIGLAIVYKLARNCGGRAWVEETRGGGCTFWVEMDHVAQN